MVPHRHHRRCDPRSATGLHRPAQAVRRVAPKAPPAVEGQQRSRCHWGHGRCLSNMRSAALWNTRRCAALLCSVLCCGSRGLTLSSLARSSLVLMFITLLATPPARIASASYEHACTHAHGHACLAHGFGLQARIKTPGAHACRRACGRPLVAAGRRRACPQDTNPSRTQDNRPVLQLEAQTCPLRVCLTAKRNELMQSHASGSA